MRKLILWGTGLGAAGFAAWWFHGPGHRQDIYGYLIVIADGLYSGNRTIVTYIGCIAAGTVIWFLAASWRLWPVVFARRPRRVQGGAR